MTNWFNYTNRIRCNWLVITVNFLILHAVTEKNSHPQCGESIKCVFQTYINGAQPLTPVILILKNDLSQWLQIEHEWSLALQKYIFPVVLHYCSRTSGTCNNYTASNVIAVSNDITQHQFYFTSRWLES